MKLSRRPNLNYNNWNCKKQTRLIANKVFSYPDGHRSISIKGNSTIFSPSGTLDFFLNQFRVWDAHEVPP
ncbi:hypothetical protein C5167_031616 [Papaver somniferum]|uniref:Uncharacterized protein n=1 Tax=Papaver somniferum TaxID=3469 RepID=A0A4Y7K7M4_PAPSO|nr:hypothetical protein C5167_031616 [Papaver somniferum]